MPQSKEKPPHLWIEVGAYRIEYRSRMWLGSDETIPHGVVESEQYSQVSYIGEEIEFPILSNGVLKEMIQPLPTGFDLLFKDVQDTSNQRH